MHVVLLHSNGACRIIIIINEIKNTYIHIGCPNAYQTRQFFNNSKTNEDIATRIEQEYVRCVRNEEECVCSKIMSVCV